MFTSVSWSADQSRLSISTHRINAGTIFSIWTTCVCPFSAACIKTVRVVYRLSKELTSTPLEISARTIQASPTDALCSNLRQSYSGSCFFTSSKHALARSRSPTKKSAKCRFPKTSITNFLLQNNRHTHWSWFPNSAVWFSSSTITSGGGNSGNRRDVWPYGSARTQGKRVPRKKGDLGADCIWSEGAMLDTCGKIVPGNVSLPLFKT